MKHFIITGSSKGIGKALAETLLDREDVRVTGISRSNAMEHPRFRHMRIDLDDTEAAIRAFPAVFEWEGEFEEIVLINNAGYLGEMAYLADLEPQEIARAYRVNLLAPSLLINAFLKAFKGSNARKKVINISSGAAKKAYDGWSSYCTTKAGLDMLTEVAHLENQIRDGDFLIRSLAPGVVETGMQEQIRETDRSDFSRVDRFHKLKEEQKLQTPGEAARRIISFIEQLEKYPDPIYDIRDIDV